MLRHALLPLVLLLAVAPAQAEENLLDPARTAPAPRTVDRAVRPAVPEDRKADLDALFERLAAAKTPAEAQPTEQRILATFNESGSATVDLLMGWANEAIQKRAFPRALDLVDQVVALKPDYAEGYNRRATIYYLTDDYSRAMDDIRTTLALEPRHFGALTGLAAILAEIGDEGRARAIFEKALAVNPQMTSAREALDKLKTDEAGQAL